jgi:hypothetical protein
MDICSKISSFFHACLAPNTNISSFFYACLAPNTSAVIVRNSDMDKSIHNDEFLSEHSLCNSCETDLDLSEKLEKIIQILEEVNNEEKDDENVFYDEAYEDKEEKNSSGKFSLI